MIPSFDHHDAMGFVPGDILSQLAVTPSSACPYCIAYPSIPCVAHMDTDDGHSGPGNRSSPVSKPDPAPR